MAPRLGILGGTGLYTLGPGPKIAVETPHGDVTLEHHTWKGRDVFFIPRHGADHHAPPHRVNHRANIAALQAARCDHIVGVYNVGGLRPDLRAGSLAVVDDFIDLHRRPVATRFKDRAVHVAFSEPYCPTVRTTIARAASPPLPRVVYAGVDGPRFETPAERRLLAQQGADVVGMTAVPEAVLAREHGLCLGGLAFVANGPQGTPATARTIQARLARQSRRLRTTLQRLCTALPSTKTCHCEDATRGASLAHPGGRPRGA